jgi:hypothetical protein
MVVCFDFDGTVDDKRMQRIVLKMVRDRNEVWIVTARKENKFNKGILQPVLDRVGLTEHNVIYCNEKPKWELLKGINADLYIDNISDEFQTLKEHTNIIPLLWDNR